MSMIAIPLRRPMTPRDPHEHGRVATPLELLFDLVFVVAIASNAAQLHHAIAENHLAAGVVGYSMAWFAIWWAWMGFTWFASAYDNDDALYRVLVFVIMAGSLVLAASIPDLFADGQSVLAVTGYAVMRLGLVALWLRAAHGDPAHRRTALRYAAGITVVQLLWIARLWAPEGLLVASFFLLVACELAVPVWAEGRSGASPWHRHHIAERFALMTIIALGEVLLSSTMAVQEADRVGADMVPLVLGGLCLVFGVWWVYFKREHHDLTDGGLVTWLFGYGHLVLFASIAALGAGLAAAVDAVSAHKDGGTAVWVMAVALALATMTIAVIRHPGDRSWVNVGRAVVVAAGALVVAALPLPTPWAILALGGVVVLVVAQHVVQSGRTRPAVA